MVVSEEDNKVEGGDDEEAKASLNMAAKRGQNFKQVMSVAYKENQLHNVVRFVTDYLRQVIENGSRFTSGHFFIMLLQLSASEVKNKAAQFIKILAEELQIPRDQYQRFVMGLKDDKLAAAFSLIESEVYEAQSEYE